MFSRHPSGWVALSICRTVIFQHFVAEINSLSTFCPFRSKYCGLSTDQPLASSSKAGSGARARAVTMSARGRPGPFADILDTPGDYRDLGREHCRGCREKGGFSLVCLDQVDLHVRPQQFQHQPGKPGAAAEIDQASGIGPEMRRELGAVREVPPPHIVERRRADEIDAALP